MPMRRCAPWSQALSPGKTWRLGAPTWKKPSSNSYRRERTNESVYAPRNLADRTRPVLSVSSCRRTHRVLSALFGAVWLRIARAGDTRWQYGDHDCHRRLWWHLVLPGGNGTTPCQRAQQRLVPATRPPPHRPLEDSGGPYAGGDSPRAARDAPDL